MPPAISDDDASDAGDVSVTTLTKREKRPVSAKIEPQDEDVEDEPIENGDAEEEDDEEGDEELEEDEFIVEKIVAHTIEEDGSIRYKVKWEGYDKKSDQTWESEENLQQNASSILDDYLLEIGGRDKIFEDSADVKKSKKRGRASTGATASASASKRSRKDHPKSASPPASANVPAWKVPSGSWEEHVAALDAAQDEKTGALIIYLDWKGGQRTKHPTEVIYKRCPQKMLQFYERHVRIVKHEPMAPVDGE